MTPVHFLILLLRQSVANPSRITPRARQDAGGIPLLQEPNGVVGDDFLGRVVTPERIERERERSIERKKRRLVGNFGGDRKSDQDLESGHVVLMSKTEQSPLFISMQTGLIKRIGLSTAYTIARHMQQSSSKSVPALCFGVLFNQTHGMGQERSTSWQKNKLWQRMRYLPL